MTVKTAKQKVTGVQEVFCIVKKSGKRGIKTSMVIDLAHKKGVHNADRYLRNLQEQKMVKGVKSKDSLMKIWTIV